MASPTRVDHSYLFIRVYPCSSAVRIFLIPSLGTLAVILVISSLSSALSASSCSYISSAVNLRLFFGIMGED